MGFLHKLWDETLAGPTPDTGLSKLRKFDSVRDPITRTITILSPNSNFRSFPSDPSSDSDPSRTHLTTRTPSGNFKKFARRKSSAQPPEHAGDDECFGPLRQDVKNIIQQRLYRRDSMASDLCI